MSAPRNIYLDGTAWRVDVLRQGLRFRAYIPFAGDRAAALAKAVAVRDEFYAAHGRTRVPRSCVGP